MGSIITNYHKTMLQPIEDITGWRFWRGSAAEFVGMMCLTLIGCGSVSEGEWQKREDFDILRISLAFGLIVMAVCWCIGYQSGGHVNPAITVGFLSIGKIGLLRASIYVLMQLAGSTAGAACLYGLSVKERKVSLGNVSNFTLGMTIPRDGLLSGQSVGVEIFNTFILAFTVSASCDSTRGDLVGSSKPLSIGLAVTACHIFAIKYTGASINPARTFGPSMIMGVWKQHWVYWVGPLLGSVPAFVFYELLFVGDHTHSDFKYREGAGGDRRSSVDSHGNYRVSKMRKSKVPVYDEEDKGTFDEDNSKKK